MSKTLLAGLSALALASAAGAASLSLNSNEADWAETADRLVDAHWTDAMPGVSVRVTQGNTVLYAHAAGMADLDADAAVNTDTVFRLASITKQFTAAVILQLVDEGALSLDDTLGELFEGYPEPGAGATVRQLLNHTSGIQSYTGIPGWMVEANTARFYTTEELVAEFSHLPSPSAPGEVYAYNNSGYVMLGAIIELKTGMAWHEAIVERISEPLGLKTLRYGGEESSIANMAVGYSRDGDGNVSGSLPIDMSVPHAAGALIANTEDLALWADALHGGEVVSPALYAQMIAPTMMPDGSEVPYGYGLAPADIRGQHAIGHSGGIFGFATDSIYVPEADLFVSVLSNSDQPPINPGVLMRRVASFALGDPYPIFEEAAIDPASLEELFGAYAIEGGTDTRNFFERDGQLYTQRSDSGESEVYAAGDDRFFYGPNSLSWFEIERTEDGAHVMSMYQQGESPAEPAIRTGDIPEVVIADVPAETLQRYVGRYLLGGAELAIVMTDSGSLEAQLTGQPSFGLQPSSQTDFLVVGVGARLVFSAGDPAPSVTLFQGGQEIVAERMAD